MASEGRSTTTWFFIALALTMTLCLGCLGVGLVATRWLGGKVSDVVQVQEPTEEINSTPTTSALPTPAGSLDQALLTGKLLADTVVPNNDPIELAERLRGIPDVPRVMATSADPIQLGTVQTFWVGNVDTIENFEIDAELVYISDNVYFWIEKGVKYDLDDVKTLVDDFQANAYPTNRDFFGSEWSPGVDGDVHLYILYARNLGEWVAGYFSTADELSPLAHPYSNAHEMFYLSADTMNLWDTYTAGVLAHEFQHMIHWSLDRNEESWVNEGFSELAAHLNGFDIGGWDYAYADDPDLALTYWPTNGEAHYGQSFLFWAYFLDRFGSDATKAVAADPKNGLVSIDEVLANLGMNEPGAAKALNADDVFRDWTVTLLIDDPTLDQGRYSYSSYSPPSVQESASVDTCPSGRQSGQVEQYGIDYIHLDCQGFVSLTFDGASTVPVLPAKPHSGDYTFWSNRGDESDMRLTRRFDLQSVTSPVELSYWTWYDIEEGWDYLYLEASIDGGATWHIVETPSGTDEDLSGNSYGWGYSGYSGGGNEPAWINESVDLSPYAGEDLLLRFEYITDAAVNGDGLLLDDISIDATGYMEDFESGDGGWQAEGFVRLYNHLPQTYNLTFVQTGADPVVKFIPLDEANHGEVELDLGSGQDPSYLIISGTTRYSWQPAPYEFELTP